MATFVLVHGAADTAWYWHLVEPELGGFSAKRILRPNRQPRPGRYRAIAPRFTFIGPDDIQVICQRAVSSPWRRVPRR